MKPRLRIVTPPSSFGPFAAAWDAASGERGTPESRPVAAAIVELLGDVRGRSVYEMATGNGFLARYLARGGAQVTASDVAPELVALAAAKSPELGVRYLAREAADVSGLTPSSFDRVVIMQGAFYIQDIAAVFASAAHLLAPGGLLVFSVPHPLNPLVRKTSGAADWFGMPLDLLAIGKRYLHSYSARLAARWQDGGGRKATYRFYHRPLSTYVAALRETGFVVTDLREPKSVVRAGAALGRVSIPGFAVIAARKEDRVS